MTEHVTFLSHSCHIPSFRADSQIPEPDSPIPKIHWPEFLNPGGGSIPGRNLENSGNVGQFFGAVFNYGGTLKQMTTEK